MSKYILKIKQERVVITLILFFLLSHSGFCQGLSVTSGTTISATGGNMVLSGDVTNNGSFINNDNAIVFSGNTQSLSGTTPVSFNDITIDQGSTTTINTPGQTVNGILLCNGILNANDYLTLLSTDTRSALIDGRGTGEVNGNVTMQKYLPLGFGYKYLSSPFQASQVSEFSDNMKLDDPFPAFYRYDESRTTSGWVTYIDPAGLLEPMQGYSVNFGTTATPIIFDVTGVVSNGSISTTLYNHNNTYSKGFNLVGNPYPSPVDWDSPVGWTRVNVDNALYYFQASTTDEYGGTYITYLNGVSSSDSATNLIPSMQGFFVHVSDGAWPVTGSITINNDARVADLTHPLIKSDADSRPLIRLTAEYKNDSVSADPVVIYFDEKATDKFDGQLDALKLMNTDYFVTNFYTVGSDGTKLSISALPLILDTLYRVPLGLNINLDGPVIFKIRTLQGNLSDMKIFITDLAREINYELLPGEFYEVNLAAGNYENRFYLDFKNLDTGIPDTGEDELFSIYCSHGILKLDINNLTGASGDLIITNLAGQPLLVKEYNAPGYYELNPALKSGIYIVSFISGTKRSTKKIFIQDQ